MTGAVLAQLILKTRFALFRQFAALAFESEPPGADFLFVCFGTGAVTENEAPGRALEIETFAVAPPIIEVVSFVPVASGSTRATSSQSGQVMVFAGIA